MRRLVPLISAILLFSAFVRGQELSGQWTLNPARSDNIQAISKPPHPVIKLKQHDGVLSVSGGAGVDGPFESYEYPLNGSEKKQRVGDSTWSTRTKWEGSALLVNTLVSGPQNYTIMERWRPSRDGATLSIKRTIVRMGGETESVLVYENRAARKEVAVAATAPALVSRPATTQAATPEYCVDAGTRILLSLVNTVDTRHTSPGDRVYLQTEAPVFTGGRVVIPRGSYVTGTVTDSKGAGRVKGRASLYLRFDSITLPNGTTRDLRSRIGGGLDHDVDRAEGKITGDGAKGRDAGTIGKTTAAGASIGSIATRSAAGAGIGAAAGAAAGVIGVLGSRGPDVILRRGTTMEMVLDREIKFSGSEL